MKKVLLIGMVAVAMCSCGSKDIQQQLSQADIDSIVNQKVAERLAEQNVDNNVSTDVSDDHATSTQANSSKSLVGKYRLASDTSSWTLDVNSDGSCQFHSNGKTYYGSWEWREYKEAYQLTLSDDFYLYIKGNEELIYLPLIDKNCEWMYTDVTAFDAKNPNKRVQLTRIEK